VLRSFLQYQGSRESGTRQKISKMGVNLFFFSSWA
jgi:hypothetical protein